MNASSIALFGYIGWTLALIIGIEVARTYLVVAKGHVASRFQPDGADVSPFMHRLCRAHANCVEHFPIFGGLLIVALATGQTKITGPLALYFLGARLAQSMAHLASGSALAVNIRFAFFAMQLAIACYWLAGLVASLHA